MTPDDLVTLREIEQLKYRYLRTLDLQEWDGFAEVFEPDATGSYGPVLRFDSAAEIVSIMRESLGPDIITVHRVHHPEVTLSGLGERSGDWSADCAGRMAAGTWMLMDRVIAVSHGVLIEGRRCTGTTTAAGLTVSGGSPGRGTRGSTSRRCRWPMCPAGS